MAYALMIVEPVGQRQARTEAEGRELLRRAVESPSLREAMLREQRRRRPAYGASKMTEGWKELYASLLEAAASGGPVRSGADPAGDSAYAHAGADRDR